MQLRGALAALAFAALAPGASASRAASLAQARVWLSSHGSRPQEDELKDLKVENPEAYAIVKALLTKRSLGLLDPKHPTASFAGPPAQAAAGPAESSVDFAASQGVTGKSQALEQKASTVESADVYQEAAPAPHHAHKDWLNWRPADSATDDDAQVAQVLGAVAQLKGGAAPSGSLAATGQHLAEAAAPQPAAPAQESNSYLKGIDFGADARKASERPTSAENPYLKATGLVGARQVVSQQQAQATAAAPAEAPRAKTQPNSYLKDIGLAEAKHAMSQDDSNHNYLTDFNWNDDGDSKAPQASAARVLRRQPEESVPQAGGKKNALVAWLGNTWNSAGPSKFAEQPAAASRSVPAAPAAKPTEDTPAGHYNVYMKDLQ